MAESTAGDGQQLLPLINHLARVGRRAADTCSAGCLRPRHLIALKLVGERGPMTQHALGAALSLDPSNVVGLLNELEERDLITRRRDPADRRRHIVELSDSGSAELERAYREFGAVEDDLFKMLSVEERTTLYTLLARAVAALAPPDSVGCAAGECTGAEFTGAECTPIESTGGGPAGLSFPGSGEVSYRDGGPRCCAASSPSSSSSRGPRLPGPAPAVPARCTLLAVILPHLRLRH